MAKQKTFIEPNQGENTPPAEQAQQSETITQPAQDNGISAINPETQAPPVLIQTAEKEGKQDLAKAQEDKDAYVKQDGINRATSEADMFPLTTQPAPDNATPGATLSTAPPTLIEVSMTQEQYTKWQAQQAEEKNKAAAEAFNKVPTDKENADHQFNLRQYGEGYVVARNQAGEKIFSKTAWEFLGGSQNKDGYSQVVKTPPEVQALQK